MKKVILGVGILTGVLGACIYKKFKKLKEDNIYVLLDDGYKVINKYLTRAENKK